MLKLPAFWINPAKLATANQNWSLLHVASIQGSKWGFNSPGHLDSSILTSDHPIQGNLTSDFNVHNWFWAGKAIKPFDQTTTKTHSLNTTSIDRQNLHFTWMNLNDSSNMHDSWMILDDPGWSWMNLRYFNWPNVSWVTSISTLGRFTRI